jgi:hypothetical protein
VLYVWREIHTHSYLFCNSSALNVMESVTVDHGDFLSDEILASLESPHAFLLQDEGFLSLHVMFGQPQKKALQLKALVKNQALVVLIDSGSSHTFLNSSISCKMKLTQTHIRLMYVTVANGETLACHSEVQNFVWWCQGHIFIVDAKVIETRAYDLVLSMD